jgi:Cu/Zn superoxide dismutase
MKTDFKSLLLHTVIASFIICLPGCDDDDEPQPQLTGETKSYTLSPVSNSGVGGTVTFAERDDENVLITIQLTGAPSGGLHPAHIHANSAAETGAIVLSLNAVNGGKSETAVNALDDGTPFTYADVASFDGHVNVHTSAEDLSLIAQADIGGNELTGTTKQYALGPVADPDISGIAVFAERLSGETLVTVSLQNTTDGETHKSHIHANSAAETGGVVIDLSDVDGSTGMAHSHVSQLNDGTPITYDELLSFDGYINVHSGSTFIAQGDIGGNELTGEEKMYQLSPVAIPTVTGTATFAKRKNGNTLVTVALGNTEPGTYFSHIHEKTVAESGAIMISLNAVDGTTGMARTTVRKLDDVKGGAPITYDELLGFNGYLNVHGGGSFIAQGDIGQNELTGVKETYTLNELNASGVTGTATFEKRVNGKTQITLALTGTVDGGDHPAHIHANSAADTGGIVLDLENVNGATGKSITSANALRDGTAITYDELVNYNGHINVHESPTNLGTRIAQGNIGSNVP